MGETKKKSVTYNPHNKIGRLIEEVTITSSDVRDLLWLDRGIELLKKNNAPPKEILEYLLEVSSFHAGKLEKVRALIALESRKTEVDLEQAMNLNQKEAVVKNSSVVNNTNRKKTLVDKSKIN